MEAERLGGRLADQQLVAVYTSPIASAVRTAESVIGTRGLAAQERAELRARGDGESILEVRQRALTFLAAVRQEHADGHILIVTHGTVLRLLLAHFLEMRPDQITTLEAVGGALSIVDDYEVPLIMAINDTCHLEGVISTSDAQVR